MEINKNYKNKIGIYCIKNVYNNKIYIGSSKSLYSRIKAHYNKLKTNKHYNKHLQNSWNKHGEDNFKCFLLAVCKQEELIMLEDIFIDKMNPDYNQKNASGTFVTEMLKQRISNTLKDKYQKGLPKQGNKYILVYSRETAKLLHEFDSVRSASVNLNINESSVRKVLLGIRAFSTDYIFRYKENDDREVNPIILNSLTRSRKFKEIRFKGPNKKLKPITITNIHTYEQYKFNSHLEAANFFEFKTHTKFSQAVRRSLKNGKPWRKTFLFSHCSV